MRDEITHKGKITKVSQNIVTVSIVPTNDECCKCAISSLCSKSEEIDVPYHNPSPDLIGAEVTVAAPAGMHRKATVLFLLVPILLLIATAATLLCIGVSEGVASVSAIATVVVWYLILYAARIKIRRQAVFTIKSIN